MKKIILFTITLLIFSFPVSAHDSHHYGYKPSALSKTLDRAIEREKVRLMERDLEFRMKRYDLQKEVDRLNVIIENLKANCKTE